MTHCFVFAAVLSYNLIEDYFQCDSGYFGIDCSIPSVYSLAYDWPSWLQQPMNLPDLKILSNNPINVIVKKKRPLIYVYDLPAEFDSHLLEVSLYHKFCSLYSQRFAAALRSQDMFYFRDDILS